MRVINTPRANSIATAEQTLTLMLAVSRYTVPAHNSLAAGEWNRSQFVGAELYGKTLGVIGFGYIGRLVAARAQAFGMTVISRPIPTSTRAWPTKWAWSCCRSTRCWAGPT